MPKTPRQPIHRSLSITQTSMKPKRSTSVLELVSRKRQRKSYGQKGPEIKFLDIASSFTNSTSGQVAGMTFMAQGTTNITRIANKVNIKSAAVRGTYASTTIGTADNPNHIRWSIVLDKEPSGTIASYTDIYKSSTWDSFTNIDNSDRFVILATGSWCHGAKSQTSGLAYSDGGLANTIDAFRKTDIEAKYVGTGATQASIGSNQLLFTYVTSVTDANMALLFNTRVRFTDE